MDSPPGTFEPQCVLGYSEDQVRQLIGKERLNEFRTYMLMRTYAVCNVNGRCAEAHGNVFYPTDVLRFIEQRVQRTASPLSIAQVNAIHDAWTRHRQAAR
ncbi:hypothetical protein QFE97_12870 [Bacillus subtilis]|nr:hypothetical protein QFE97_12870 [Bacillus subtilis]